MPGEGTSANVKGPPAEALVTGAAEAAVRLSALAAATAAAPAAAQVTARRRRCLTMSMVAPLCSAAAPGRRGRCRAGVRSARLAGFRLFSGIFFEPSGPPAAYLLPTDEPDGATRCGQQCDLAPPTTTRS